MIIILFFDNKNLIGKDVDFVLKEIINLSLEEVKLKKRIRLKSFPYDIYELECLLEELKETNGYFSGVDIYSDLIKNSLFINDLIYFCGTNGSKCSGTEKLESLSLKEVFFLF